MASVNISLSEFSELCRLCGSKTSVLLALHIFEREGDLRQIYKKITECLPIQVSNNDKLPKMVCEECVYKLDALFEFRERSMKTEYALTNMLKEMYNPVCHDTLGLHQMDTLICGEPSANGTLHVKSVEVYQQVGVELVDGNADQLEDIMTRMPSSDSSSIKCEPEMILKVENSVLRKSDLHPEIESDNDSDGLAAHVDQSDACTLSDLQVQDIRTLEAMEDSSIKTDISQSNTDYLVHSEAEHPWFFCNICGKPFDNSDEFQAHCEIHWKKCTLCGISCANDETLLIHMRESHDPFESLSEPTTPLLPLPQEPKKPPEQKKQTKGDMKVCNQCGKEYRTNYKLAEHMRKHSGDKPFKCSVCEKAFRSKIGLAQHEAQHTGQYDYTCNTCGKGFQCKSYLIVHQRVHSDIKPYPCDTCGRSFKTKQSLLDHQNRHLGVKPYLCETCGRGFITKGLCKAHQKVHSGTDNRQYPCSVCNKLFVSKSYLATHLRIHTGEKPFMCEVCGKGFLTRVDLRIHSTMHTGEKSFVCESCGKAFARRDALRCHRRSHTGERPYRCDICGQGFTQFSPMAIHKRLHTGERPYACDICEKTFVSRSTMMVHKKKHTN